MIHSVTYTSDTLSGLFDDLYHFGKVMAMTYYGLCSMDCVEDAIADKALEIGIDHNVIKVGSDVSISTTIQLMFDDDVEEDEVFDDEDDEDDDCGFDVLLPDTSTTITPAKAANEFDPLSQPFITLVLAY